MYKQDLEEKGLFWFIYDRLPKIPWFGRVCQKLIRTVLPKQVQFRKWQFRIDPLDLVVSETIVRTGDWEPFESAIFVKHIKSGQTVVDIGAHIGTYTIPAAAAVGPNGKVFAFEPNPDNFTLLQENLRLNNFQNVVLSPAAVADYDGKTALYLDRNNTGDHRIFSSHQKYCKNPIKKQKHIGVKTVKLDTFFNNKQKIDVLKIDAQGAETVILKGAQAVIARSNPLVILIEVFPEGLLQSGSSQAELLSLLQQFRFKLSIIDEQNQRLLPFRAKKIRQKNFRTDDFGTNLLGIKKY